MPPKPTMKSEIAIRNINYVHHWIGLQATADSVQGLEEFGNLTNFEGTDSWDLWVDARYDFYEVAAYIRELGKGS